MSARIHLDAERGAIGYLDGTRTPEVAVHVEYDPGHADRALEILDTLVARIKAQAVRP